MKKINVKNKTLIISALAIISLLSITTLAYFTSQDKVTNKIQTGDVDITVEEIVGEVDENLNWPKEVKIKNDSKSPVLIRVSIIPRWQDGNKPYLGDSTLIKLNFTNIANEGDYRIGTEKWVKGNDGYYYYNTIVDTGKATKEILRSVQLNLPDDKKNIYEGKDLKVDVKAEAIQATTDAYKAAWTSIKDKSEIDKMIKKLCIR